MHRSLAIEERMQSLGRKVVRDHMPDQHRAFFENLRFIVLSAIDTEGRVWPFMRTGSSGFLQSPQPTELVISSEPLPGEPPGLQLTKGAKISVLGIEFETKRRNRMNGTITRVDNSQLHISVDQSYGNCPRFIHVREIVENKSKQTSNVAQTSTFSAADCDQIKRADMLFIASRAPKLTNDPHNGVDVNHRGGLPGFVHVLDNRTLIIPDYDGNKFFNTFGNIMCDPQCGILFPDFQTGSFLTLNGHAKVIRDDPAGLETYGSNRYLRFEADTVRHAAAGFPFRYILKEASRNPPEPPRAML